MPLIVFWTAAPLSDMVVWIAIVLLTLLGWLLLWQFGLRLLYSYRVNSRGIEIMLFSLIPVARFTLRRVLSARCLSREGRFALWNPFFLNPFTTLRLGNRLFGPVVLVERAPGLIRTILLTPDDPDSFVRELNAAADALRSSASLGSSASERRHAQ
jgi:hypothetical protein